MAATTHDETLAGINIHFAKTMQEAFEKDNSFLKALKGDSSLSLMGEVNYKYGLGDMPSSATTRVTPNTGTATANPVIAQRYYYPVLENAIPFEMSNSLIRRTDVQAPLMEFLSQTPEVVINSVNDAMIARIKGVVANEVAITGGDGNVVNSIALSTGTPDATNRISRDAVLKTLSLLGERGNQSRYIAMHSNTYWALRSLEDATFFKNSDPQFLGKMSSAGGFTGEKYLGMNIIVDDKLTLGTVDGDALDQTLVLMFADGAFSVNYGAPTMLHNPYEIFSNGSGAVQTNAVWVHNHFISGYSWTTSSQAVLDPSNASYAAQVAAGTDPSDANLALAANNGRIVSKQNLKFCALTVNVSSI